MARRPFPHRPVHHRGRLYPVIGVERVRGREYLLLQELGAPERPRYLAFDPHAGLRGEFRRLTVLPQSDDSRQHLQALFRTRRTNDAFSIVLAWEERPKSWVLVHDWVEGDDLQTYLDRGKANPKFVISPYEAVRLVRGLAHGLKWLHGPARLVHADIKPANVILNRQVGRMILIDFGSAWPMERTAWRVGEGITPSYSAPELQGATGVANERVDQFSASVVFYEMLTGELPYGWGGKAGRLEFAAAKAKGYQPPSALAASRYPLTNRIWELIDHAVTTGVAFDPDRRFPTDSAWVAALDAVWHELQSVRFDPPPATGILTRLRDYFRGR